MSELDQDQAGTTADEAHDNPGTLDDEIDLTPAPTEPQDNDEKLPEDVLHG